MAAGTTAQSKRIEVAPEVLRWARESAGLDLALAAKRIRVKPDALAKWESGAVAPTIGQLRRAADAYKRPLAVLLMPAPVEEREPPRDLRAVTRPHERRWSPELRLEFRRAVSQREVFLEILDLSPESVPTSHDELRTGLDKDPEVVAGAIRAALESNGWPPPGRTRAEALLNVAIAATEALGVLVIQLRRIDPSELQGFSISDWPYPVVALNGRDLPRRRLFTLMHELCHIAVNAPGICDLHETIGGANDPDDRMERYCNAVAAAVLMPETAILNDPLVQSRPPGHVWALDELRQLSDRFGASSEAVLIRLIGLGVAPQSLY